MKLNRAGHAGCRADLCGAMLQVVNGAMTDWKALQWTPEQLLKDYGETWLPMEMSRNNADYRAAYAKLDWAREEDFQVSQPPRARPSSNTCAAAAKMPHVMAKCHQLPRLCRQIPRCPLALSCNR